MFQSKQNKKDTAHILLHESPTCTNKYTVIINNNILSFSLTIKLCDQLATSTHISLTKNVIFCQVNMNGTALKVKFKIEAEGLISW